VFATNLLCLTDDWNKIKQSSEIVSLKHLKPIVLQRRFGRVAQSIKDERYKNRRVVDKHWELKSEFPDLYQKLVRAANEA